MASVYPDIAAKYPDCFGDPGKVTNSVVFEHQGFVAVERYHEVAWNAKESMLEIIGLEGEPVKFRAKSRDAAIEAFHATVAELVAQGVKP